MATLPFSEPWSSRRGREVCLLPFTRSNRLFYHFLAPKIRVEAFKELVLSAGTIGTPFLLLNSGIGDQEELKAMGIEPLLHLPSVGKNVSDHPFLANAWFVNSTDTFDNIIRNATLFNELFALWNKTETGPFVDPGGTHIAWMRLPSNSSIFEKFSDLSAGPLAPHFEMVTGVCFIDELIQNDGAVYTI